MGRALRVTAGDAVYHVLNRANGRQALCDKEGQRKRGQTTVLAWCVAGCGFRMDVRVSSNR
jgi:hypothetical protein